MQRTPERLKSILTDFIKLEGGLVAQTLSDEGCASGPPLVAIEEADGLDRGGMAYVLDFLKRASVPVVLTCNMDPKDPKMRTLSQRCNVVIPFASPSAYDVDQVLLSILATRLGRTLTIQERQLATRARERSNGDPRSAIHQLQLLFAGYNDCALPSVQPRQSEDMMAHERSPFNCARVLFQGQISLDQSLAELRDDSFLNSAMIWANYVSQVHPTEGDIDKLAQAAECQSLSDTFEGRVDRPSQYALEEVRLIVGPLSVARRVKTPTHQRLDFPSLLGNLSKVSSTNRSLKGIAGRIRHAGHYYDATDVAMDLAKNICLCVCRLLGENKIEPAADILIHYNLDLDDFETLRKASTWIDPLSGGQMRPACNNDALKELTKRLKEIRPEVVHRTFTSTMAIDVGDGFEEMADVTAVVEEEKVPEQPAPKKPKTAATKK